MLVIFHADYDDHVTMKPSTSDQLRVGDDFEIACTHHSNPKLTVLMKRPNGYCQATESMLDTFS